MAKKALLTIDNTYCKLKKGLLTADEVYNKVKKAFITIGGVYRPCWSGGELAYWGTATELSESKILMKATTVGGKGLFGGGTGANGVIAAVDVYDSSLTRTAAPPLSAGRYSIAATTVGDNALFGGGTGDIAIVDVYDASLTRTTAPSLSTGRRSFSATTVGDKALFGGGMVGSARSTVVDAYDSSLTRTIAPSLSVARDALSATTVGNKALFGGGDGDKGADGVIPRLAVVDAYDASLTRTRATDLSAGRESIAASTVGNHALFGGGAGYVNDGKFGYTAVVDAYDSSLTRTAAPSLSAGRYNMAATTVGDNALFGGGDSDNSTKYYANVDVYDASLTKGNATDLSVARRSLSATTVGDNALFAGGYSSVIGRSAVVDVYIVA